MDYFSCSLTAPAPGGDHRRVKRNVRTTLIISYALLIFVTVAFLLGFYYLFTSRVLKQNSVESLRNRAQSLSSSIDSAVSLANMVSLNVSFSSVLKEHVEEYLEYPVRPTDPGIRTEKYHKTGRIIDLIQSIIGPFKPVPQVNFYDLRGGMIGAGVVSRAIDRDYEEMPWIREIDLASGKKYLSPPHADKLIGETFEIYRGSLYISVYRTYFDTLRNPVGILEVEQFTDVIFKDFEKSRGEEISVVDTRGLQLYPYVSPVEPSQMDVLSSLAEGVPRIIRNPETGKKEMVVVRTSPQTGWRIIVSEEEDFFLSPVYRFTRIILFASLVFLCIAVLIASRFARRLIVPLREIHNTITGMDWTSISSGSPAEIPSGIDELEEIQLAVGKMHMKLQESIREAVEARTQEIQATMFALQSQADPHFIYNVLTTISIMAEEGMYDEISEVVSHLTHLLRYISSSKSRYVTLDEEIEYCRRYLACMKIRFQDHLEYSIEAPEGIGYIKVPKLIVQPVIENAMKYGIDTEPPWDIRITGSVSDKGWSLEITDNGPGFSDVRLEEIRGKVEAMKLQAPEYSMKINGMGLLNIYARLHLYYGEAAEYSIGNLPGGRGAQIILGGLNEPGKTI